MPASMLSVRSVSKRYGETVALDQVTIDFSAASVHTILGENGSGKSTLVKLLSGIVSADAGAIELDGKSLVASGPADFRAAQFATVFQEVLIAPDRSVVDNVLLGMDSLFRRNVPRGERRAMAEAVLKRI